MAVGHYVLFFPNNNPETLESGSHTLTQAILKKVFSLSPLDPGGESCPLVPNAAKAREVGEAGGEFLLVGYFCQAGLVTWVPNCSK